MNPLSAFVRGLLLLATIAFAERIVFAGYHADLHQSLSLWETAQALLAGIRFDLAVAAVLAFVAYLPAYVAQRLWGALSITILRWGIYFGAAVLVFVHGADLLYFDETGRHLGYEIKEAYNSRGELLASALRTYTWPVIAQLTLLVLAWAAIGRVLAAPVAKTRPMFAENSSWLRLMAPEGRLLLILAGAVIVVRGGLQSVPLEPLHAQSLGDSHRAALALNGSYNALFSAITPYSIERVLAATPSDEQKALVVAMYAPSATLNPAGLPGSASAAQPNVVMVFLESWSAAYMQSYGADMATTPFFDELRGHSFTTRDMLAGGHRTTEGLFATLCSAQNPLGNTIAQSQLQNYGYDCLPKILKRNGYQTAFFQGTVSGTSGTGAFVQSLGFEQSYGKEHVSDYRLPHNSWGLHDPDLYDFSLKTMDSLPQPFLVGINTNSTHDHQLPPGVAGPFDAANDAGRYGNVLHFADGALRDFVNALTERYPNTVVVILADHAGPGRGPNINLYRIPFLIHAPGRVQPGIVDGIATQRDVAPSLLQVLGLAQPGWFTGNSLLESRPTAADYYHAGVLGWVEGEAGVEVPVRQPEAARCFAARGDFAPVPCSQPASEVVRRALAATTVWQDLLFQGRLADFSAYRGAAAP